MENRMNGNAVRVWTKQHENVLRELETKGRYVARREYIQADLGEHAPLVLEAWTIPISRRTRRTLPGTESSWRNTGSATARHICPSSTRRSNGRS